MRGAWLVAVCGAALATGCTSWEPLAGMYGLVPSETQRIAVVHARAFWEAGTLDEVPAGKIHWIERPGAILEFLGAMEGQEAPKGLRGDGKEGGHRALAVLFFPEDAFSRKQIELDEHLDILPGYTQHGTVVTRSAYFTSSRFKRAVVDVLGECPVCRDYLGIHPRGGEADASSGTP